MFDLDLAELRTYRPEVAEPADFDAFWRDTIAEARRHDQKPSVEKVNNTLTLIDTYDVTFAGFAGTPVKAWLHVPAGVTGPLPTVVQYHGYSGGRCFPHGWNQWAQAGWAHLTMDTRGQGWAGGGPNPTPDMVIDAGQPHVPGFMTAGITDPHTYYYRRVFTDALRLLDAAVESPFVDPSKIIVTGGSQGGGISLAAAGLATMSGITLAGVAPDVAFLCHFRRAVELTASLPYGEITQYLAGWRDQEDATYRTLSYFDGVNFSRRAQAPALFSVALMDEVCPPSTVFAAYNAYGDGVSKAINVYPHNGHEGGGSYQIDAQLDWFAERFR